MREIKFRAWDLGAESMVDWESIKLHFSEHIEHEMVVVMQYTGLKDVHGKEVYEGDILKVTTVRGDTRWQMEVDFENGCFSLKEGPELRKLKYDYPNHEIIGNIYENPELLEESK